MCESDMVSFSALLSLPYRIVGLRCVGWGYVREIGNVFGRKGSRLVRDCRWVLMEDWMVGRSTVVSSKLQLLFSTTALRSRHCRAAHLANDVLANGSAACSCDEISQKV
jgi:hypothetical protein